MTCDILVAKDEMLTMLRTAWLTVSPSILSYVPDILYPGETKKVTPDTSKYHGSVLIDYLTNPQATLAGDLDGIGSRRYNNTGILEFQISCPLSDAENADKGTKLGIVARNAFRGKYSPSGIIFYNARVILPKTRRTIPQKSNEIYDNYFMFVDFNHYSIG